MTAEKKIGLIAIVTFVTIWVIATLLPDYTLLFNT